MDNGDFVVDTETAKEDLKPKTAPELYHAEKASRLSKGMEVLQPKLPKKRKSRRKFWGIDSVQIMAGHRIVVFNRDSNLGQ